MGTLRALQRASSSIGGQALHDFSSVRRFAWGAAANALGKGDILSNYDKKESADRKNEKADAYLESRGKPKGVVGGKGYVPPLARGDVSKAADHASVIGGTGAERSIRAWLEAGGDKGLAGSGAPLPDKEEHHQMFTSDAGTAALNRALKDAGVKPASIEAAEELRKAEERVIAGLKHAIRKNRGAVKMDLEEAVQMARDNCAQLVRLYNSKLMADKETFGMQWPLQERKQRSIDEEIALARGK